MEVENSRNGVIVLDLMTPGFKKIATGGDSVIVHNKDNFDTYQMSLDRIRDRLCSCFNVEFTLTMSNKLRKLDLELANQSFKSLLEDFQTYCKKRNYFYYYVLEEHKSGHLHAHGIISYLGILYNDYLLKTASIYKWFSRRGAKFNWCRINDLFKPYKPSEGNIKRKSANFKNWYFYLHKDINETNKVQHNDIEFMRLIPSINKVPREFRVFFNPPTCDTSLLDRMTESPQSDSDDD